MSTTARSDEHAKTGRCCLTREKAIEIYSTKLSFLRNSEESLSPQIALKGRSEPAATKFGVSAKTIRDIWNRRTWQHATWHLWAAESNDFEKSQEGALRLTKEMVNIPLSAMICTCSI